MTEIKRYDVVLVDGVPAHRPSEQGRWVKHGDLAELQDQLQRYSMSAGQVDQRKSESDAVRVALGFSADADDVAPCDLVDAIAALQEQLGNDLLAQELRKKSRPHPRRRAAMSTQQLKILAQQATPWSWKWFTSNSHNRLSSVASGKDGDVISAFKAADGAACVSISQDDMAFIEAAHPGAVLELIERLETAERERDELRAEQAEHDDQTTPPAAIAPDGYRTVPIAPTAEMLRVGGNVYEYCEENGEYPYDAARGIYSIMISAAPAPGGDAE